MASPLLPLSNIVDVVVTIAPNSPSLPTFNQGLITGSSAVIPGAGGTRPRIRQYSSLAGMIADGFSSSEPEYLAAQSYFGQNYNGPAPQFVWIGRQDLTAVTAIAIHTAGTSWAVGDQFTIGSGETVLAIGVIIAETGGVPSSIGLLDYSSGTGYTSGTNVSTTAISPSSGTGLTVNTTVGESCLIALQKCRENNLQWYAAMCTGSVTADHEAIASWIQSEQVSSFYFFATADAAVLNGTAGNVFLTLQAQEYSRVLGIYSTTQGGNAPNNTYTGAALLGVAMGLNTGLANSNFTLAFKTLVEITAEPLTQTQYSSILASDGNVYVTLGNAFTVAGNGQMPNGNQFQVTLQVDMLTSDIQYSCMDVLTENANVPQNDSGENLFIHAVNGAAARSQIRGFIATGQWTGATIAPGGPSALTSGTQLPNGYLALSAPFYLQSASARSAGQAMPIYLAIITAGTVLSITIQVNVQQGG
jgi:hypothetical protein